MTILKAEQHSTLFGPRETKCYQLCMLYDLNFWSKRRHIQRVSLIKYTIVLTSNISIFKSVFQSPEQRQRINNLRHFCAAKRREPTLNASSVIRSSRRSRKHTSSLGTQSNCCTAQFPRLPAQIGRGCYCCSTAWSPTLMKCPSNPKYTRSPPSNPSTRLKRRTCRNCSRLPTNLCSFDTHSSDWHRLIATNLPTTTHTLSARTDHASSRCCAKT